MLIANRSLHLRQGEKDLEVPIRVFAPESDGTAWSCTYEIDWPDGKRQSSAAGFDSVQALVLALQKIGVEIYTSDYHKAGILNWGDPRKNDSSKGYGFPVTPSFRDLLVGDDAKYL